MQDKQIPNLFAQEWSIYQKQNILQPPVETQFSSGSNVAGDIEWLKRTGYPELIAKCIPSDIMEALVPPTKPTEPELFFLTSVISSLFQKMHHTLNDRLNHQNARRLKTLRPDTLSHKPFRRLQNPTSLTRYISSWKKMFTFFWRTKYQSLQSLKFLLSFTPKQSTYLHQFRLVSVPLEAIRDMVVPTANFTSAEISMLNFLISLIEHPVSESFLESPLLSFCAIASWNSKAQRFYPPGRFSSTLSSLVFGFQLCIWHHTLRRYDAETLHLTTMLNTPKPSLGKLLEKRCRKWLVNTTEGPLAELLSLRLWAMKVSKTSIALPNTIWSIDNKTITYNGTVVSLMQLRSFIQLQFISISKLLDEELFLLFKPVSIDLDTIRDNFNLKSYGDSFLSASNNRLESYQSWLFKQVLNEEVINQNLPGSGFISNISNNRIVWNIQRVKRYENSIQKFLEHLFVLIHLTGGQPARGPEILRARWSNTSEVRNFFLHEGLFFWATSYHKSQSQNHGGRYVIVLLLFINYKIISNIYISWVCRFLPARVTKILFNFLVFIQPFRFHLLRQAILPPSINSPLPTQTTILPVDPRFTHLWANHCGIWSTTKLSAILERESGIEGFNVSAWRQIAIGFAKKWLVNSDLLWGNNSGLVRSTNHSNDVWDALAGHSTLTANLNYAIDVNFGIDITDSALQQYRSACLNWHHFIEIDTFAIPEVQSPNIGLQASIEEVDDDDVIVKPGRRRQLLRDLSLKRKAKAMEAPRVEPGFWPLPASNFYVGIG